MFAAEVTHFVEFPPGCISYLGPHTLECYKSIFLEVGCIENGYDWPDNLTERDLATYDYFNIR